MLLASASDGLVPSILQATRRVFAIRHMVIFAMYFPQSLENITFVFDAPAENRRSARRWTNPKAAISRLYR